MRLSDMDLGSQHGRLGFEAKYPNNTNYMYGYRSGYAFFADWCKRNLLDDGEYTTPDGTNEAIVEQPYCC